MTWHPGDDGEMQQKYKQTLELVHDDWEPQGPAPDQVDEGDALGGVAP